MTANVTTAGTSAAAAAAEAAPPVDLGDSLGPGYQLGFLLLVAVAAVLPVRLARDLLAGRRPLSAVDETLLVRVLLTCVTNPLSNGSLLAVALVSEWQGPAALRTAVCRLYSLMIVDGVGLTTAANCLISLCRLQQLAVAAHWPQLAPLLTQRWLRWQNRLLLAALLTGFSALPFLGLQPSAFFWCAGLPLPRHRPSVLVLFAINSSINCATFAASVLLLRASSGLQDTWRPRNYVPAHSWAQLCLVLVTASTVLVPINTSQLEPQLRMFLNHAAAAFMYAVLDPCLLMVMASHWRQQVREYQRQRAPQNRPERSEAVIPVIRLHLI